MNVDSLVIQYKRMGIVHRKRLQGTSLLIDPPFANGVDDAGYN